MKPEDYGYDIETYPNIFTLAALRVSDGAEWLFEISDRRNDAQALIAWMHAIRESGGRMVGFNNIGFDYPVVHLLLNNPDATAANLYDKAMLIIQSDDSDRFQHMIWENEWVVPQIDLYKIHHFDNRNRSTSLKMLEFNMRSPNIEDLPYTPGLFLTSEQMDHLIEYNKHDVRETVKFLKESEGAISFREELSVKYQRNFLNHNDTKIGKDYFIMRLEEAGVPCFNEKRRPIQTPRPQINLADAVFPHVQFGRPEFNRILTWFKQQTITETKGVFKDLLTNVDGFEFVFGLGGIHGSVESRTVCSDDEHVVRDADVTSYYPSLAIVNRVYPEHLGPTFCDIYADVKAQRVGFTKGTPENAVLKLALNGVQGDSNNPYSPFYDPLYMMKITINGQLLLCMLAEQLMAIPGLEMIQINTDGLTVRMPRSVEPMYDYICQWWQDFTRLELEFADYSRMFIRDVNNYIAEYEGDGKLKRKGAYEYDLAWHQNHSALVIPKAAEAALVHGQDIEDFIRNHDDLMDFMLRTKVPRSSKLVLDMGSFGDCKLQNITRYYITDEGGSLVKIMPPLRYKTEPRRIGINVGWSICECNDIRNATAPINPDFYVQEARKLVEPLR